jgi:hypothetical protein
MKQYNLFLLGLLILTASCHKTEISASQKLMGRWNANYYISHDVSGANIVRRDTGYYNAGTYLDFKAGNVLTVSLENVLTQTEWHLQQNDTWLAVPVNGALLSQNGGFTIQLLTTDHLELYSRNRMTSDYNELVMYFEKQ